MLKCVQVVTFLFSIFISIFALCLADLKNTTVSCSFFKSLYSVPHKQQNQILNAAAAAAAAADDDDDELDSKRH